MKISITETRNADLVFAISQHPEIEDHITNDVWAREDLAVRATGVKQLVDNPHNHVLAVCLDDQCGGCFVLDEKEPGTFEVHTMLLPSCRGLSAIVAARLAIKKAFTFEGVKKLVSYCPMNHREILFFALRCGFKKAGTVVGGWIKNGETFDLVRVEKLEEAPCH